MRFDDEQLAQIKTMFAQLLVEHDAIREAKIRRNAAAERQRRKRERDILVTRVVTKLHSKKRDKSVTRVVTFNCTQFEGIVDTDYARWQEAYPAISVPDEVERAAAWIAANPKNKKSNYERFLVNWFSKAQDNAGRVR